MPVQAEGSLLVDRYRVLRPLGTGGMATVLLCEDTRLGRRVAVKRLHADSPEEVARRFAREARLGASLNHSNIVSVFDTVADDEGVLIVMEYVEGETLRDVVRRGRLQPGRALDVVRSTADALEHAHEHGVVHRDVKPANVLLRRDGTVKLVDLGIATATDTTRITKSGVVLGTAAYMAPEQLEGAEAGPRADVYALACVAYELLSAKKARTGRTALEIAHDVARRPEPDLRDAWPEAPPALAEALKRGMALNPAERTASPRELAAALDGALRDRAAPPAPPPGREPATIREPPRDYRPVRARGGRLAAPVALALLALAAAAVAGGVLSAGGDGERQVQAPESGEEPPAEGGAGEGGDGSPGSAAPQGERGQAEGGSDGGRPAAGAGDAAEGRRLNARGYRLMRAGRYDEAIPLLQRSVRSFPAGTDDVHHAYALYNLGRSLRLAGRPDEAVPVLERRLRIPNQRPTVRRELEAARRAAAEE